MNPDQTNMILMITPLIIGGIIAAINADKVNNTTENIEGWIRRKHQKTANSKGWFSKLIIQPILWLIVKFSDWTDGFEHRGIKNGTRVAATIYLIIIWCLILYTAFIIAVVVIFGALAVYIALKIIFNSSEQPQSTKQSEQFSFFGSSLVQCKACGNKVSDKAEVCPSCGENLKEFKLFGTSTVNCRVCGNQVSDDAVNCPSCGENLKEFKLFNVQKGECRACGALVSKDAESCPSCGEKLKEFKLFGTSTINCPVCNSIMSTDNGVCLSCQENLKETKLFGSSAFNCEVCGHKVSEDAAECPKCGEIF